MASAHFRPGMRSARLDYQGITPLLMNADTLLDPVHPLTQEMRALTAKKASSRTADEEMQITYIDWRAGIYHDDELGPYLPSFAVKASLRDAARRWKLGEVVRRSLVVIEHRVPVQYDGPRDLETLWEQGYRDVRSVKNSGFNAGRVPRCRPCFDQWSISCIVAFDPAELDIAKLRRIIARAEWLGLGNYRPEFGTFRGQVTDLGGEELGEDDEGTAWNAGGRMSENQHRIVARDKEYQRIGWVPRTLIVPAAEYAIPALNQPIDTIIHRAFIARIAGRRFA